jgi:hypothetical protein
MPLTLPPDLAAEAVTALSWDRTPAVRRFLALVRAERAWSTAWPRRLVAVAERFGFSLTGPRYCRVVMLSGFGWSHLVAAIAVLAGIGLRVIFQREQRVIYAGNRSLLVLGAGEPLRHGPGPLPAPMQYASPAGAVEAPETTSREAGPRPWRPGEILTR